MKHMVWVWKKQLLKSLRASVVGPPGVRVGAQVTKAVAKGQGWLWVVKMAAQLPESARITWGASANPQHPELPQKTI